MRLDPITPKGSGRDDNVKVEKSMKHRIRSVWLSSLIEQGEAGEAAGNETIII